MREESAAFVGWLIWILRFRNGCEGRYKEYLISACSDIIIRASCMQAILSVGETYLTIIR